MKYIMIIWLCINDPSIPIERTCIQIPMGEVYDSLNECRIASVKIYKEIEKENIYMSSFCGAKDLTTI